MFLVEQNPLFTLVCYDVGYFMIIVNFANEF